MVAYKIKYYRKGFFADLLPVFFPDSIQMVVAESAEEAIRKFYENKNKNKFEIYDIKGVR